MDATVVVIEHGILLVSSLSDRLYCMTLGRVIAEGSPDEVRRHPAVIAAYLGTDDWAIQPLVLPFLELPSPLLALVQPVHAVLDPLCNTAATLAVITSPVGPGYQPPIDAVFSVSLFYILTTCGQIQAPAA